MFLFLQLCARFSSKVTHIRARRHIPVTLIKELNFQLLDHTKDLDLVGQIEDLADRVQSASPGTLSTTSSRRSSLESCDSVRLESGIYLIRNRNDSEDSLDDVPMQAGDIAMKEVTLRVPDGPFSSVAGAGSADDRNDLNTDDVFPLKGATEDTDLSKVASYLESNVRDVTEHDGTSQQPEGQRSLSFEGVITVDSSRDMVDSKISLDSASKVPTGTIQVKYQTDLSCDRLDSTPKTEHNNNSTCENINTLGNSTNSETTSDWQDVELEELGTTHENILDQGAAVNWSTNRTDTTQGEDSLLHELQGEDSSLNHPQHLDFLEVQDIATCSGPRTTPSPELAPGLNMSNWDQNSGHDGEMKEESFQSNVLERSSDFDVVSQDSFSLNDISAATSPGKESVPFSKSSSVPIHNSASSSALATSHSYGASPPSLHQATAEPPPMRRTMSVPTNVAEAEIGAVVVRRRLSGSGKSKEKKKKKRKSKIAEIGKFSLSFSTSNCLLSTHYSQATAVDLWEFLSPNSSFSLVLIHTSFYQ